MPTPAERRQMDHINATIRNLERYARQIRANAAQAERNARDCERGGNHQGAADFRRFAEQYERDARNVDVQIGQYQRDYNTLARRPD